METHDRYQELAARLRKHAADYPAPLRRLGQALWQETEEPMTHEECLDALPEYIEAELAGEAVAKQYPQLKHHLDRCDECAQLYAELLDSEWAAEQETLGETPLPAPDLSFLPAHELSLRETVLGWTRGILRQISPPDLAQLDLVAPSFFVQLRPRAAHESRSPYLHNLSLDRDEASAARTVLAAGYATTQHLVTQVTRAEFDTWLGRGELESGVTAQAAYAARELRLERGMAERFARNYALQVSADPSLLRSLLK